MKLIIAEKPSLGKNIASALKASKRGDGFLEGNGYIISWAFGHLFSLKDVDDYLGEKKKWHEVPLPFFPDSFDFELKKDRKTKAVDTGVKKQFEILKRLIHRDDVTEIVNCGDADREGQIIIDIILDYSKTNKKITRLWLPEQTEETIISSMNELKDNSLYSNLHNEGLARTYMDWLMGINLTRYVSLKSSALFPCGRVLIPIVKFIYDRDMAIKNFTSEKYFILESNTKASGEKVLLSLKNPKYPESEKEKALEKAASLNKEKAIVKDIKTKKITKRAPKLFSLSKLQSKLSKDFKISFSDSLSLIQKLYDSGYITYPRTNTEYLAENEKVKVEKLINKLNQAQEHKLVMKNTKSIFDDSKIESHSAIIPTTKLPQNLFGLEKTIYETIFNRFLCNFLDEECIINQTKLEITVGDLTFNLNGDTLISEGYLKIEPEKIENKLPNLSLHQEFEVNFIPIEKKTTPPKKVTESELSNYLKNPFKKSEQEELNEDNDDDEYRAILKGVEIGTEATRTGIIENAKLYKYISQNKQQYSIEPKGELFIDLLDSLKIDLYKEKTVELSILQKEIYKGTKSIDDAILKVKDELLSITSQKDISIESLLQASSDIISRPSSKEIIGKCPRCKGKVYENSKSFYCSNYKNGCKFSLWKEDKFFKSRGKKITKTIAKELLKSGKVEIKKLKSKAGNEYDAIFILKDDGNYVNFELEFVNKSFNRLNYL